MCINDKIQENEQLIRLKKIEIFSNRSNDENGTYFDSILDWAQWHEFQIEFCIFKVIIIFQRFYGQLQAI